MGRYSIAARAVSTWEGSWSGASVSYTIQGTYFSYSYRMVETLKHEPPMVVGEGTAMRYVSGCLAVASRHADSSSSQRLLQLGRL